jgi:hypothetical protein
MKNYSGNADPFEQQSDTGRCHSHPEQRDQHYPLAANPVAETPEDNSASDLLLAAEGARGRMFVRPNFCEIGK